MAKGSPTKAKAPKAKAAGKAKKTKKVKDPNAPKKPLTAYFCFLRDVREETKKENPDAKMGELGKIMGAMWSKLDDAAKEKYVKENAAEKVRYEKEMKAYKPPAAEEEEDEEEEDEESD